MDLVCPFFVLLQANRMGTWQSVFNFRFFIFKLKDFFVN